MSKEESKPDFVFHLPDKVKFTKEQHEGGCCGSCMSDLEYGSPSPYDYWCCCKSIVGDDSQEALDKFNSTDLEARGK